MEALCAQFARELIKQALALLESLAIILFQLHDFLEVVQLFWVVLSCEALLTHDCHGQRTHRDMGGPKVEELRLNERQVKQEAGVDQDSRLWDSDGSAVVLEESLSGSAVDVKGNDF